MDKPRHSVIYEDTIDQASLRTRQPFVVVPKKEPFIKEQRKIIIDTLIEIIGRTVSNASEEERQVVQDLVFKPETGTA